MAHHLGGISQYLVEGRVCIMAPESRKSPTRIALYRDCARKWAIKEVVGIGVEHVSTAFGSAVHAELEMLHQPDRRLVVPQCWNPALAKQRAKEVYDWQRTHGFLGGELEMELDLPELPYQGRADYVWVRDERVVLFDYKTTDWGPKYTSVLTQDPQANLYAHMLMCKYGVSLVECIWLYVPRDIPPPFVLPVYATVTREVAELYHRKACDAVRSMERIERSGRMPTAAWETDRSGATCKAYGGCPYKDRCHEVGPGRPSFESVSAAFGDQRTVVVEDRQAHRRAQAREGGGFGSDRGRKI